MLVCGGFSTCCSVSRGVVTVARNWRIRAGRHLANSPRSPRPKKTPPPPLSLPPRPGCWPFPCWPFPGWPLLWPLPPFLARSFSRHAWIFCVSACVGGAMFRLTLMRSPPVLIFATIFGTLPSWCTACRVRPEETAATPSSAAICFAWLCANVSCVPGRKKSWTKWAPGLPSFERSVITDEFASTRSRSPPPPPPNGPPPPPPWSLWAVRVTVRSVPIPASGSRVAFCASSSPFDRLEIAITSPTPIASPSSVMIVRPFRRRSSARR